ncbi:MAG TPA: hypothetical protein VG476_10970 [Acidimicrobiales bacterium]|nr:hypothetical protein [Acidimicrobiales bacterium]
MAVSPVRRRLEAEVLERPWTAPEHADPWDVASSELGRVEAVAWIQRRLAWEHRLAGLRQRAMAGDVSRAGSEG